MGSHAASLLFLVDSLALAAVLGCAPEAKSPPSIAALRVTPYSAVLDPGETIALRAAWSLEDGSTRDAAASVRWIVPTDSVARVEMTDSGAMLRALSPGATVLVAVGEGRSAQAPIVVRARAPQGPLRVDERNPRYFRTANGELVYLTGSHTWTAVQDDGVVDPPPPFDFEAFLDFIELRGHNLVRLWVWEQASWATDVEGGYHIAPLPWARTGPGLARDGKPRFDLETFDEEYFERLRSRLESVQRRGLYVAIMLFNGWSVRPLGLELANPWHGHPMHRDNNVNGIDGDPRDLDRGDATHTLQVPEVTALQAAYARRVVETAAGFENVLYEISNESPDISVAWQEHMIAVIREHEARLGVEHPVGMTAQWPGGVNERLFASSADWISPAATHVDRPLEPMIAEGRKVILYDTDHICGTCGDVPWVWKSLTRGLQPLFMDSYDNHATGLGAATDTVPEALREAIRLNLGWARTYAERLDLRRAVPKPSLASTPYAIADLDGPRPALLAFTAAARVTIAWPRVLGPFAVEWFRVDTGETLEGGSVGPGSRLELDSPVEPPVLLFLEALPERAALGE